MSDVRRNLVSPAKATWELDWQGSDNILKIATFDEKNKLSKTKEVSNAIREKIQNLENLKIFSQPSRKKLMKLRSKKNELASEEVGEGLFKRFSKCVHLLIRCFNARKKNAIPHGELIFASYEYDSATSDRSSINLNLKKIFTSPPTLRAAEDLRKAASFLRASGAAVAIMGPTNAADDENLARFVSYERFMHLRTSDESYGERYENGRILAEQGRSLDRFYFVLRGKILLVKEYHVGNSVISKTTSILTKGHTTNADEMMRDSTRHHSLVGKGTVEALVLDRDDYFALRRDKKSGAKEYLTSHPLLKYFPSQVLPDKDGNMLQLTHYPKGSLVFSGGTEYEWIYVIKSGNCSLVRSQHLKNVSSQKKSLFNKHNAQELGCEKSQMKRYRVMADFRVWNRATSLKMGDDTSNQNTRKLENKQRNTSNNENQLPDSLAFPPISTNDGSDRSPLYDVINPIDAAMAGVTTKTRQVLVRPRMLASTLRHSKEKTNAVTTRRAAKSAPPSLRDACVELGRLKPGHIFGLDDLYEPDEKINELALLSNGADVVKIKKRFFLQHAPVNLLMQLSSLYHDFPTVMETQKIIEQIDTWTLYKRSLIKVLKKDKFSLYQSEPIEKKRPNIKNQHTTASRTTTAKTINLSQRQRLATSAPAMQRSFSLLRKNSSLLRKSFTSTANDVKNSVYR